MNKNTDSYLLLTFLRVCLVTEWVSGIAVLCGVVQQSLATVHSLQYRRTLWV